MRKVCAFEIIVLKSSLGEWRELLEGFARSSHGNGKNAVEDLNCCHH